MRTFLILAIIFVIAISGAPVVVNKMQSWYRGLAQNHITQINKQTEE